MSQRFILIHNQLDWSLDFTDQLLNLRGYPTEFLGMIQFIPGYVYNPHERIAALELLIEELINCAPPDTPASQISQLTQMRKRLALGQLSGEHLQTAEKQLLWSFGQEQLPKILTPPEGRYQLIQPKRSRQIPWNWIFVLILAGSAAAYWQGWL